MANVKVSMSKKGVLIGLIVLVLVLGGGGGYLLWRVNQKDTVAPTDSSAHEENCVLRCKANATCGPRTAAGDNCQENEAGICYYGPYGDTKTGCCEYEKICNITAYHITFNKGEGGTVSPGGQQSVKPGNSVSSTATPSSGYKFTGWQGSGGGNVSDTSSPTLTISNVNSDATYTATFEALPVETVTLRYIAEPTIGGEIRGKAEQTVEKGKDGEQVVATPKTGYEFVKWEDNGSTVSSRQDTNVQGNITGKAIFQKAEAPVTCGDGICSEGENPLNCPQDCSSVCGDGMCTGNETPLTCPADCPPVCGDGICSSGENSQNCPVDCGSGKVPDTAIFDDTKDTIIFGMAILLVGMAWTWISTLPKKAYSKISKVSSEYITEAKLTRERNTRESRRNRLERRIR